jgi:hypothetical protein
VEQLKWEVRRMFQAGNAMDLPDDTVTLVDALERLGVDNHFREEIDVALSRIHGDGEDDTDVGSSHNLHAVALRFCLLRQHGFWVPTGTYRSASYYGNLISWSLQEKENFVKISNMSNLNIFIQMCLTNSEMA